MENLLEREITDPAKGDSAYVFDPRILGLTPALSPTSTIEGCLAYGDAKSVDWWAGKPWKASAPGMCAS